MAEVMGPNWQPKEEDKVKEEDKEDSDREAHPKFPTSRLVKRKSHHQDESDSE